MVRLVLTMRHGSETKNAERLIMKLRWVIVLGIVAAAITLGLVVSAVYSGSLLERPSIF